MATLAEQLAAQGLAMPPPEMTLPVTEVGGPMTLPPVEIGGPPPSLAQNLAARAPMVLPPTDVVDVPQLAPKRTSVPTVNLSGSQSPELARLLARGGDLDTSAMGTPTEASPSGGLITYQAPARAVAPSGPARPSHDPGLAANEYYTTGPTERASVSDALASSEATAASNADKAGQDMAVHQSAAFGQEQHANDVLAQHAATEAANEKRVEDRMAQFDALAKNFASSSVDSERLWNSRSTAGKVGGMIGAFFGGLGAQANGGKNSFLEQWNRAVDHDIEAQRANIDVKGKSVENARSALGIAMQRVGDAHAAENQVRALYADKTAAEAQRLAAGTKNVEIQAKAAELIDAMKMQKAQYLNQSIQFLNPALAPRVGAASSGVAGTVKVEPDQVVPLGGGRAITARTKDEAIKLRAQVAITEDIRKNLMRMAELSKHASIVDKLNGASTYSLEMRRLLADTDTKRNTKEGQGAMSEGDKRNTEQAMGAVSGLGMIRDNSNLFLETAKGLDQTMKTNIKSQGGTYVREVQGTDKNGQIVRQYVPDSGGDAPSAPSSFRPAGQ